MLTRPFPRPVRLGRVLLGLALVIALAGCTSPAAELEEGPVADPTSTPFYQNTTILDHPFTASVQRQSVPLTVPAGGPNGTMIQIWVAMNEGAWQGFNMDGLPPACADVTTHNGLVIGLGTNNGSGGSVCELPAGSYEVGWHLDAGAAQGRLTIVAQVPV